jgi:hypothetical protein
MNNKDLIEQLDNNEEPRCSNCGYEVDELDADTQLCQTCKNAYDLGASRFEYKGYQIVIEVLSNFLSGWDIEQNVDEIFTEGNQSTVIWEPYCDWDLELLHDHVLQIINGIERILK